MNPFYNVTANPIARTQGRSDVIRAEYAAIEAGFDGVKAQLDLKAPLNSPTFTGSVVFASGSIDAAGVSSFTAPTVTPVWDATNKVATTAFVIAAIGASGSLLPPQGGSAGKFLRTDGTVASWQDPPAPDWPAILNKPTTLAGYGITNGQHAIEWLSNGVRVATGVVRLDFRGFNVTSNGETLRISAPVFPHFLLLAQGVI